MKSLRLIIVSTLLIANVSCNRDDAKINQSAVTSISLSSSVPFLMGYVYDQSANELYVGINDREVGAAVIKKISLSNMSEIKTGVIPEVFFHGGDNILFTERGEIVTGLRNVFNASNMLVRLNSNLDILSSDTFNVGPSGYERIRLCQTSSGNISGAINLFDSVGNNFMRYVMMNNEGTVIKTVDDTSSVYNDLIVGSDYMQTSDGNFVYICRNFIPPFYSSDLMMEKRDEDFNLIWRSSVGGPATENPFSAVEHGGKIYIYGQGTDLDDDFKTQLIIWVFDQAGNLLDTKAIKSGALDDQTMDPIIPTEDGGFLITALTSLNAKPDTRRGILYKTDADLNVIKSFTYGGSSAVFNGGMIKTGENRYLLVYDDNSFAPDGNNYRMVLRFVDQNGDYIE